MKHPARFLKTALCAAIGTLLYSELLHAQIWPGGAPPFPAPWPALVYMAYPPATNPSYGVALTNGAGTIMNGQTTQWGFQTQQLTSKLVLPQLSKYDVVLDLVEGNNLIFTNQSGTALPEGNLTGGAIRFGTAPTNGVTTVPNDFERLTILNNGNVGVNQSQPISMFQVTDGNVVFNAPGSPPSGVPFEDVSGTRFMWIPYKSAIRAGAVNPFLPQAWNASNMGQYSVAMGNGPEAKGESSVAMGERSIAIGTAAAAFGLTSQANGAYSVAIGVGSIADGEGSVALGSAHTVGNYSVAFGQSSQTVGANAIAGGNGAETHGSNSISVGDHTDAAGTASVAFGDHTTSAGNNAMSIGLYTSAPSVSSLVIGQYNDNSDYTGTGNTWVDSDPVFLVGDGTSDVARSNAFVIMKDGKVGVGESRPKNTVDVSGKMVIGAGYTGVSTGAAAPANGLLVEGNTGLGTTTPQNKLDIEGAAVIGSGYAGAETAPSNGLLVEGKVGIGVVDPDVELHVQDGEILLDYSDPLVAPGRFWTNGATIRSGWRDAAWETTPGPYSVAMGRLVAATGIASVALGYGSARDDNAIAINGNAVGSSSIAIGGSAEGDFSMALMNASSASGLGAFAAGEGAQAEGAGSTAVGLAAYAEGDFSAALGRTWAQAYRSTTVGSSNILGGTTDSWVGTDPIFVIGNGASDAARSNAMTVLKNGKMGIGTTTPQNLLDIEGGAVIGAGYSGTNTAPTNGLLVEGNTGLGTTTAVNLLDVEGGAVIGASYSGTSTAPTNGLLVEGNTGLGTTTAVNLLDIEGGAVIGASYSGTNMAPTNGLLVQGNVGIGTTSTSALLHTANGSVLFSGVLGSTPVSGAGTRFMWVGSKGALRAGAVVGTEWDDANIGTNSIALGSSVTASGNQSTAFGLSNTASGTASLATGGVTTASGTNSLTAGNLTTASGTNSLAAGYTTVASGSHSAALGYETEAKPYASVAVGRFNEIPGSANQTVWVSTDPLFVIGNGASSGSRANAVTALKNGNVGIGTSNPQNLLDVEGGVVIGSGYAGTSTAPADGLIVEGHVGIAGMASSYELKIAGSAEATAWDITSDQRFKRDIEQIGNALDKVLALRGVTYNWRSKEFPEWNFPEGGSIGFIAQELERILPEVVSTEPFDGHKSVNYMEIIPILAEAIKEQHTIISEVETKGVKASGALSAENERLNRELTRVNAQLGEQESRIAQLEEALRQLTAQDINLLHRQNNGDARESGALLYQNNPNPFSDVTKIGYYIPSGAIYAELALYAAGSGKEIQRLPIGTRGQGELTVSGRDLESGTYQYVLTVDGQTIESKSMIVVK